MAVQNMEVCSNKKTGRQLRQRLLQALVKPGWLQEVKSLEAEAQRLVCPLFSALFNCDPRIRWHAVSAFGLVVPQLAEQSMERARVVMRRFIWNLTDESGGIGWGAPEAMAEIMARHQGLAAEFHSILCSYIFDKEGPDNFLEYTPLRQGAYWGVARLAQARPGYAQKAVSDLQKALQTEQDPYILGLAGLALGLIQGPEALEATGFLKGEDKGIELYWNHEFLQTSVGEMALAGENVHKWRFES